MDAVKELRDLKKEELKELRELKKNSIPEKMKEIEVKIQRLEEFIGWLNKSNLEPRELDGIVINYKLYEKLMKKLKDFQVRQYVSGGVFFIDYIKPNYLKPDLGGGSYRLYDLRSLFPEDVSFKKADLIEV